MSQDEHRRAALAIIGIGCRFPGGVNDPAGMWQLLREGRDGISEISPERWSQSTYHYPEPSPGTTQITRMGAIEGVDQFDPYFFGISPREAAVMDPQQRLVLETAVEALEDAGQRLDALAGTRTGVFAGVSFSDYGRLSSPEYFDYHSTAGVAAAIIPNRVSHCFDLRGPSVSIDTACSSSLVAVHMACRSLWNRESDLALAAGANVLLDPTGFVAFSRAAIINPEGRCYAFDARAQGFVRSEGVGVVVLKRLDEALRDGDPVYAVVLNSRVNQDGRSIALGVPSAEAQEELLRKVYREAGIDPQRVLFVEAHGTGTPVGDPIEARGIGRALAGRNGHELLLGSVKTNLGHLECGSGVTGLIKTALALRHRVVPPNLNFAVPNPEIPFAELGLRVPVENVPFPPAELPWVAGVNSFGFGGTNAHIVLTEPPAAEPIEAPPAPSRFVLPISARSPASLQAMLRAYRDFLADAPDPLYDVCYTAALRRSHHRYRVAVVGETAAELVDALDARLRGPVQGAAVSGDERRLAFVYTGQGAQWWGMGRQLLEREPVFRAVVERCDAIIRELGGWSLLAQLTADEAASQMDVTAIAQPAIFALQAGLTELWRARGIEPDGVVGHSVGEVAAAYAAGVLSLEEATRVIFHRGRCMELASPHGQMLAVGLAPDAVAPYLESFGAAISLAAINSPTSVTLAGQPEPLQAVAAALEGRNVFCRFLRVNYAFHSAQMDPVESELRAALADLAPAAGQLPFCSTVTGDVVEGTSLDADYWWRNVRQTVRFGPAIGGLIAGGYRLFLEVGPHPALAGPLNECLRHDGTRGVVLGSLQRGADDSERLSDAFGGLYASGHAIDWRRIYPARGRVVSLPRYAWQHERHWHEAPLRRWDRVTDLVHPLLGRPLPMAQPTWSNRLDLVRHHFAQHLRFDGHPLLPAAAFVEMALAAGLALRSELPVIEDLAFERPCFLPGSGFAPVQTSCAADDGAFAVHTHDDALQFAAHARGRVRAGRGAARPPRVAVAEIRRRLARSLTADQVYEHLARRGFEYGAPVRVVERAWRDDGEVLAEIRRPEEGDGYCWHPLHLDACLQMALLAQPNGSRTPLLLAAIEGCSVYRVPGETAYAHVRLRRASEGFLDCDLTVFDPDGEVRAALSGVRFAAAEQSAGAAAGITYEPYWRLEHHPIRQRERRNRTSLPAPAQVVASIERAVAERPAAMPDRMEEFDRYMEDSQRMAAEIVADALAKLGWDPRPGDRFTAEGLRSQLGVSVGHERLFADYLRMFAEDGYLARDGEHWVVLAPPRRRDGEGLVAIMRASMPVREPWVDVLARCVPHLPDVLTDRLQATDVLFPGGSVEQVSDFYTNSPVFAAINRQLECVSAALVEGFPAGYRLRVLEVGAGTGAATAKLLPGLPPELTEYVYTDLSSHFFRQARQRFADYPFVHYQTLDLEQDPMAQGFAEHGHDVVIIYQVVHATNDIRQSMRHVARLLAPEGLLVVVEVERPLPRMASLTFGLTWGWWRFSDLDLRQASPLLTEPEWRQVFAETGLVDTAVLRSRMATAGNLLMVARAPAGEPAGAAAAEPPAGTFLVLADGGGVGDQLAARLVAQGVACALVRPGDRFTRAAAGRFTARPDSIEDLGAVIEASAPLAGVVHLWNLDAEATPADARRLRADADRGAYSVVRLAQALERCEAMPRLWLVTRAAWAVGDGEPVSPAGAAAWGVARAVLAGHPGARGVLVDLDGRGGDQCEALFAEIWHGPAGEEVALRGAQRFLHRIRRVAAHSLAAPDRTGHPRDLPYRLEAFGAGDDDRVALVATAVPEPGPDEVTVEVAASGLTAADLLKVAHRFPRGPGADALGSELAGTVTRVGRAVTRFQVGDRVMGLGLHCFASHVTTPADLLAPVPAGMSFAEAATVPVAFLAAHLALVHQAGVAAGERVLIHAAASGVGLAAVQVAQRAGARVLATAGSAAKREHLRSLGVERVMDSRSLDFAEAVMAETDGAGVDVVLNSLTGDAVEASLSLLAPYGRFIELGRRDPLAGRRPALRPLDENRSFATVDLQHVATHRPALIRAAFERIAPGFADGTYAPLPHRSYPITAAGAAFAALARAEHVGKLIFSHAVDAVVVRPRPQPPLAAEASYLVCGALDGYALAVAEWMVGEGARHVLLAHRDPPAPDAQAALDRLRVGGAAVEAVAADLGDPAPVTRLLAEIARGRPRIRGVVYIAGAASPGRLAEVDDARWNQVLGRTLAEAWVLHEQTRSLPLDFFLLCSPSAAMTADAEHAVEAAAGAVLESIAGHRRALGLPAQAIAWGPIQGADEGLFADGALGGGQLLLDPRDALEPVDGLLRSGRAGVTIARIDWARYRARWGAEGLPGRFERMAAAQEPDPAGDAPALHLLAAATGERRRALVVEWLAARAARVLGCEVERVERARPLREMGLDSLTSFELLNWAQEAFGVPLATSDLAHWPSVEDLADHILELRDAETPPPTLQMPARSAPQPAANAARSQDAVPEEVAAAP